MRSPDKTGWSSSALRLFTALSLGLAAPTEEVMATTVVTAPGEQAAEPAGFRFQDVDGKTVRLDNFRGQWVVVNFWAHWCPLCWPEVPELNALNALEDVAVIGVAMDYGPDVMAVYQAIKRQDMRYGTQVLGGNRISLDAAYHQVGPVSFYPTTYIFNPKGGRHARINGPLSIKRFMAVTRDER